MHVHTYADMYIHTLYYYCYLLYRSNFSQGDTGCGRCHAQYKIHTPGQLQKYYKDFTQNIEMLY